jgi:tRNA dimethylallyltransferase
MVQQKIILLAGPTSSGKSDLAIRLAEHFNGEVINADSMQIYKEISILTSKPKLNENKNIKHHLYGFNSVKKKFSTGCWLKMAEKKIEDLWKNHKTPIVVGGTGLYFKALTDGLVKIPDIPNNIREDVRKMHKKLGQKKFFSKLIQFDPLAEKSILSTDSQRSMRTYEVKKFTNKSLFEFIKDTKPKYKSSIFKKLFIDTPKDLLHKKIAFKVEKMFDDGAVKEVEGFLKMKVYRELSSNKIIGIKEIRDFLSGKATLIETKKLIIQKTRQYAKRQFTWSRGHMKSWEMVYSPDINDLVKKTINKIS